MSDFTDSFFWEEVAGVHDATQHTASLVRGKVAVAQWWPHLASSQNETDFSNRLEMLSERMASVVDPEVWDEVRSSLYDDYRAVHEASDNSAKHKCENCNGSGEVYDHDCPQCGGSGFSRKAAKKEATNYQPDPNRDWRYHQPYEQLQQPVNNGALQDTDGFPIDLAQDEHRDVDRMEFQTTPGQWHDTPGTAMPERPMPFSQQRGYVPVAAKQAVFHEDYGQVSRPQLAAYRKHNVPPAMHDELAGYFGGENHDAITRYVKAKGEKGPLNYGDVYRDKPSASGHLRELEEGGGGWGHFGSRYDADGFLVQADYKSFASYTVGPPVIPGGNHKVYEDGREIAGMPDNGAAHDVARSASEADEAHILGREHAAQGIYANPYSQDHEHSDRRFAPDSRYLQYERGHAGQDRTGFGVDDPLHGVYDENYRQAARKESNKYIKQQGDKWVITQKGTGKVLSHHDSQEEAEASFRAMMESKHGSAIGPAVDWIGAGGLASLPLTARPLLNGAQKLFGTTDEEQGYKAGHDDGFHGRDPQTHDGRGPYKKIYNRNYQEGYGHGQQMAATGSRFDSEGFLVQADANQPQVGTGGRAHSPLVDPPPGTPQKVNPYYFNTDEAAMGANDGFPVQPTQDPYDRVNELYGDQQPAQSAQDTSPTIDGQGYSRATSSGSPNFNATAAAVDKTDGKIVDHCPGCDAPRRIHTTPHGNEIRHIHNNHVRCHGSRTALMPNGGNVGGHDAPLSFSDALAYTSNYGTSLDTDELQFLASLWGSNVRSGRVVLADYLGRPDASNPTGRGPDEYRARTWDAYQTTRPMQSMEDRNVNTPVLPQDPIKKGPNINTPQPGLKDDRPAVDDEDDDEDED